MLIGSSPQVSYTELEIQKQLMVLERDRKQADIIVCQNCKNFLKNPAPPTTKEKPLLS
jgi:hypothetical protein